MGQTTFQIHQTVLGHDKATKSTGLRIVGRTELQKPIDFTLPMNEADKFLASNEISNTNQLFGRIGRLTWQQPDMSDIKFDGLVSYGMEHNNEEEVEPPVAAAPPPPPAPAPAPQIVGKGGPKIRIGK